MPTDQIHFWSTMSTSNSRSQNAALQNLVERMTIWQDVTGFGSEDQLFNTKLTQYAELLANSGRMTSAMRQLSRLRTDTEQSSVLRDRIFNSLPADQRAQFGQQGKQWDPVLTSERVRGSGASAPRLYQRRDFHSLTWGISIV